MSNAGNSKPKRFDLEERTEKFATRVGKFVECLPKSMSNLEYGKQLIRSSGSVGANYIEANEALSKKDFVMRIKICRKESKESVTGCVSYTAMKLPAMNSKFSSKNPQN